MKDYKLIGRVGIRGSGKGQLCYPRGVSVDYNGEVYVADYDNNISTALPDHKCWNIIK